MSKTRDKVYDAAGNVKPYVDRAMSDEKLREDVMSAFATAKELYNELIGGRGPVTLATRVATDDDVRDKLKDAVEDLRSAAERLQGKREHHGRNTTLLVAGIALGLLFNPITGPETRRWVKEMIGGGDDFGGDYPSSGSNGGAGTGA
jgi:gas vesicle protein